MPGTGRRVLVKEIGAASPGVASVLAAVTDTGAQQVITTGILPLARQGRITATAGGTAADIKAIQVTIGGTDPAGVAITEALPAFTVNTAGTVTGDKVFATVNSVTIPAHDGTGATTSVGAAGVPVVADTNGIHAAVTDTGVQQVITTAINFPDVPRNITATSAGTAADIKAIQVIIAGLDEGGKVITETLPVFTENTATTVVGAKAFAKVTSITIPAHDGNGATTAIGFGDVLGLGVHLSRNTVQRAFLNKVLESTAPTVVFSATVLDGNTIDLNSALASTPVTVELLQT